MNINKMPIPLSQQDHKKGEEGKRGRGEEGKPVVNYLPPIPTMRKANAPVKSPRAAPPFITTTSTETY